MGLIRRLNSAKWNLLAKASPAGYIVAILFAYTATAAASSVSLVFAAFLAGFALRTNDQQFAEALDSISRFSFGVFIPVYFAVVGCRLDLSKSLSVSILLLFLLLACGLKLICVAVGAKFAGFANFHALNLAIATNARGGPGIVLASVAFDAGIINPAFFSSLVLLAVLTSQAAGAWLEFVLRKGWPLLSGERVQIMSQPGTSIYTEKTRPG